MTGELSTFEWYCAHGDARPPQDELAARLAPIEEVASHEILRASLFSDKLLMAADMERPGGSHYLDRVTRRLYEFIVEPLDQFDCADA